MPPIELLDDDEELELELDGIPNAEDDEFELVAEVKAPGRFIASGGWPPALVLEGDPKLPLVLARYLRAAQGAGRLARIRLGRRIGSGRGGIGVVAGINAYGRPEIEARRHA